MLNEENEIKNDLLDRLVDGELPDGEYRTLLDRLEDSPDGWPRCLSCPFWNSKRYSEILKQMLKEGQRFDSLDDADLETRWRGLSGAPRVTTQDRWERWLGQPWVALDGGVGGRSFAFRRRLGISAVWLVGSPRSTNNLSIQVQGLQIRVLQVHQAFASKPSMEPATVIHYDSQGGSSEPTPTSSGPRRSDTRSRPFPNLPRSDSLSSASRQLVEPQLPNKLNGVSTSCHARRRRIYFDRRLFCSRLSVPKKSIYVPLSTAKIRP